MDELQTTDEATFKAVRFGISRVLGEMRTSYDNEVLNKATAAAIAAIRAHDAAGADWEAVARELDELDRASGSKADDGTVSPMYWRGRQCAYREAAALIRERRPVARVDDAMVSVGARAVYEDEPVTMSRDDSGPVEEPRTWEQLDASERELYEHNARLCLAAALAHLGTPAAQPAREPAQPAEGVSDAVSHAVAGAYDQGYRACRSAHGYSRACCVYAGLRAAFAAAQVVPRAELEAMRRRHKEAVDQYIAADMRGTAAEERCDDLGQVVRDTEKELAAANARAETAEQAVSLLRELQKRDVLVRVLLSPGDEHSKDDQQALMLLLALLRLDLGAPAPRAERDMGAELDALKMTLHEFFRDVYLSGQPMRVHAANALNALGEVKTLDALSAGKAVSRG